MDVAHVLAVWLHTLALVIVLGYYGVLGRVVLPAFERSLDGSAQASALMAIERRAAPAARPLDRAVHRDRRLPPGHRPRYAGLGNVFASTWTTLMFVKHVLVVGLVVLGVAVDRLVRRVAAATSDDARAQRSIASS